MYGNGTYVIKLGGLVTGADNASGVIDQLADGIRNLVDNDKKVVIVGSAFKGPGKNVTDLLEGHSSYIRKNGLKGFGDEFYRIHHDFAQDHGIGEEVENELRLLTDQTVRIAAELVEFEKNLPNRIGHSYLATEFWEHMTAVGNKAYSGLGNIQGNLSPNVINDSVEQGLEGCMSSFYKPLYDYITQLRYAERLDALLPRGELVSMPLLTQILRKKCIKAKYFSNEETGIITNRDYCNSWPIDGVSKSLVQDRLGSALKEGNVVIVPGYAGVSFSGIEDFLKNNSLDGTEVSEELLPKFIRSVEEELAGKINLITTTFGRGGTELTAAIIQNYLGAQESYWLKGAVGGVHTGDPGIIDIGKSEQDTKVIDVLDYLLAKECAGVQDRAITYASANNLDIIVMGLDDFGKMAKGENISARTKITSLPERGPLLSDGTKTYAVAGNKDVLQIKLEWVEDRPGILADVAGILGAYGFNVVTDETDASIPNFFVKGKEANYEPVVSALREAGFTQERGVDIKTGLYSHIRLSSEIIHRGDRRKFMNIIEKTVEKDDYYAVSGFEKGTHTVSCFVPKKYYEELTREFHNVFVKGKRMKNKKRTDDSQRTLDFSGGDL